MSDKINQDKVVEWLPTPFADLDEMVAPFYCPLCNKGVHYSDPTCWFCGAQNKKQINENK